MKSKSKSGLLFYSIAKKFQSLKEYIMEFIMYRNCDAMKKKNAKYLVII